MIVPDVNLLIHAVDESSPRHVAAKAWWLAVLNGGEPVGLPWSTALAFVRLTTSRRIFERPFTVEQATGLLDGWLAVPHVVPIEPARDHLARIATLLGQAGTAGNLVTDAHLAALAMEHGATLASADADFTRFPGLRWLNPLA